MTRAIGYYPFEDEDVVKMIEENLIEKGADDSQGLYINANGNQGWSGRVRTGIQ